MKGFLVGLAMLAWVSALESATARDLHAAYARAEAYLPQNVGTLASDLAVRPSWPEGASYFWHRREVPEGWQYTRIDPGSGKRAPLFDHAAAARALTSATGESLQPNRLPIEDLRIDKAGAIVFRAFEKFWRFDSEGGLSETVASAEDSAAVSPDGRWEAVIRGGNLHVRSRADGTEIALTTDADEQVFYGHRLPNPAAIRRNAPLLPDGPADVVWSPDSTRLATYRIDTAGAGTLTLVQSVPPERLRPRTVTYHYALTGDAKVPRATAHVFHVPSGRRVDLEIEPVPILYYYGLDFEWRADSRRVTTDVSNRGWSVLRLVEADSDDGATRDIVVERSDSFVASHRSKWTLVEEWDQYLWAAELGGWPHLQLIDASSGEVVRQLTRGSWAVKSVAHVDTKTGAIYFVATGREPDRDPYLRHLYRVERSGGQPRLLTPESVDHEIHISPDGACFVDNMSRADAPTRTVLRSTNDGAILRELLTADISALEATGFVMPEPFETLAADGRTAIYGVIYRPADFDASRRYPVIDNIYTGPHYVMAPKTFEAALKGRTANALAQLGFIVVLVDGRGTSGRSREFLDHAYRRLGSVGLDDHEAAIRAMAKRYPYMDTERVGVYGFSAGGFDAARALLHKPGFYKVGVAASGNHDHRSDKASWNEMWMGYPLGEHYDRESNLQWADRLQGKLLLAHGELDENVHPMATLQLVDALVKANKDFDLLIMPDMGHYLNDSPYYLRRQWDFFVRHLQGVEPPAGYAIAPFDEE